MNQDLLDTLLSVDEPEQYPLLIEEHNLSLTTIQQLKDHSAQFRFSDPAETLRIAQAAYELSLHMDQEAQALGQWTLGNAMMHSGDFRRADQLFQAAREAYFAADNLLDAARMGLGHVVVLGYIGETERALVLAKEIEPILDSASQNSPEDLERLGKLLMNLGNVYELIGQYEEALEIYQRQVPIAAELGNQLLLGQAKHNQAYALVQLNAFEEAQSLYADAEQIFLAEGAYSQLTTLHINQVTLFVHVGQFEQARLVHQKAEASLTGGSQQDWQIHSLPALQALIDLEAGHDIEDSLVEQLLEAQTILSKSGTASREGAVLAMLGRCYTQRTEWEAAEAIYTQLDALATQSGEVGLQVYASAGLAQISISQDRIEEAVARCQQVIDLIESVRRDLQIEAFRTGFLTDKLFAYQELTLLYLQQEDTYSAFQTIERAKARLISEKLAVRFVDDMRDLMHATHAEDHLLTEQLERTLQELDDLYPQIRLQALTQDEALPQTVASVRNLEAETTEIIRKIQRTLPRFASLSIADTASIRDVMQIGDGHIFLQYYTIRDRIWILILDESGLTRFQELASISELETAYKAFSASIERFWELLTKLGISKTARYFTQLQSDCQTHLAHIHRLLIEPIDKYLPADAHLTISPDHVLYYIPFHALFDGTNYLVERHEISYIPNATSLLFCMQPHRAKGQGSLLIGYDNENQLESTNTEIASISDYLQRNGQNTVDVHLQSDATTTNFLSTVASYRHIHLAAHAEFRVDTPMLSSIALADRRLTLAEIAQLKLNADLVVLSGCETGQGRLYGNDSVSLASGFLGAGARSLLVSLWKIDDSATAKFMEQFYQHFLSGSSASLALAQAQRYFLKHESQLEENVEMYAHPAYWAPFILFGSD